MGWFGSVCSFVSNAVSSTVSAVGRVASAAYEKVREVGASAVGWMAEKAESFVDGVRNTWNTVKPYVSAIRLALKGAAAVVPPWLKGALLMLDQGLGALTAFENSPIAKKVEQAIAWAIKLAKRWRSKPEKEREQENEHEQESDRLNADELAQAKRHQENLRFAEREIVSEEQRHQLELAAVFNDFEIANTELANAIDGEPSNFEHYLRLRATQKLLAMADKKFRSAQSVDDLSADDLFLVRTASDLIKENPELTRNAAERLDRLLSQRYGKKLTPFVFEELIASWSKRAETLSQQWKESNKAYAKDASLYKFLAGAQEIQSELSDEETRQLEALKAELPTQKKTLDHLATSQRDIERYVGAAEGFLQVLEKTPEEIEKEDRIYLLDEGEQVGKLLIDCAQNDKSFNMLDAEDQALITAYANIFKAESKVRMKSLLEVTA